MGKSYWMKDQKGNFSNEKNDTFDETKRYVGTRLQQGVPLLDRDWNELEDIRRYEEMITRKEYIGNGSPDDGFKISATDPPSDDFVIGKGRCMVDGFEVENTIEYLTFSKYNSELSNLLRNSQEFTLSLDVWIEEITGTSELKNIQDVNTETCLRHELNWGIRVLGRGFEQNKNHHYYSIAKITKINKQISQDSITDLRSAVGLVAATTGVVVFLEPSKKQISDLIYAGLGRSPIHVVLGLEDNIKRTKEGIMFAGDPCLSIIFGLSRTIYLGAMIYPKSGMFKVGINVIKPDDDEPIHVRWWAFKPGQEKGEIIVKADPSVLRSIEPATASVTVGKTQAFTAKDQFGLTMTATWKSDKPTVGTIDAIGMFTATGVGSATITAANGTVYRTATVNVNPPKPVLTTITVSSATAPINIGETQLLTATARDQNGAPMAGIDISFTSNKLAVGNVSSSSPVTTDGNGTAKTIFKASGAGSATITAANGTVNDTATVTVNPPKPVLTTITISQTNSIASGSTQEFIATARDQNGAPMAGIEISFTSSKGYVTPQSPNTIADGTAKTTFTAVSAGIVTIIAANGTVRDTATVMVTPGPLASIIVSPSSIILNSFGYQLFTAGGKDENYNEVSIQVTWRNAGDNSVGGINEKGEFRALGYKIWPKDHENTTTIEATSKSIYGKIVTGTATVTIRSPI